MASCPQNHVSSPEEKFYNNCSKRAWPVLEHSSDVGCGEVNGSVASRNLVLCPNRLNEKHGESLRKLNSGFYSQPGRRVKHSRARVNRDPICEGLER